MSFGVEMGSIRATIRKTVEVLGYVPILIDELLIDSDQTINDAILSHLKGAKFCIADFTEQKDGVYFESGNALGRGILVIYSCHGLNRLILILITCLILYMAMELEVKLIKSNQGND